MVGLIIISGVYLLPEWLAIRRRRKALENVPGLDEKFIIGHGHNFANKSPSEIFESMEEIYKKQGKAWKFFLFNTTMFLTADPKNMEVSGFSKVIFILRHSVHGAPNN